jgi:hypothetical protein
VSIDESNPQATGIPALEVVAQTEAARWELAPIVSDASGQADYSGPLLSDVDFGAFSHSALVRIADEVCLQMHLLNLSFGIAVRARAGDNAELATAIGTKQLTGIAGVAAERIRFLPPIGSWEEHMAAYNQLDVALDATPWSSATTGFDALAMGVPLVAIRGGCTSARMSSAILRGLGRPEWIAETPGQFGAIVAGLCADLPALRAGKQSLREEVLASPLFDGADLCRALEQAFQAMAAQTKEKAPVVGA